MASPKVKIVWTKRATGDLQAAHVHWCTEESVSAGDIMLDRILSSMEMLKSFPEAGRRGRVVGTRELVIPRTPFIAAYRIGRSRIQIIALLHGARKWPNTM